MPLSLTRAVGQSLYVGDLKVTVTDVGPDGFVQLDVNAPRAIERRTRGAITEIDGVVRIVATRRSGRLHKAVLSISAPVTMKVLREELVER